MEDGKEKPLLEAGAVKTSEKVTYMTKLAGSYHMTQRKLVNLETGLTLTIGTRQRPTPKKPPNFLLMDTHPGKRVYLSSLYDYGPDGAENGLQGYRFEVDGVWHHLELDRGAGMATVRGPIDKPQGGRLTGLNGVQNCASSINNAQSRSKSDPSPDTTGHPKKVQTDPAGMAKLPVIQLKRGENG
jgi:hypothetical protein